VGCCESRAARQVIYNIPSDFCRGVKIRVTVFTKRIGCSGEVAIRGSLAVTCSLMIGGTHILLKNNKLVKI